MRKVRVKTGVDTYILIDVIESSAMVQRSLNGNDQITMTCVSETPLDLPIGSSVTVTHKPLQSLHYYMMNLPMCEKESSTRFVYSLVFKHAIFELEKIDFLFEGESEFFFTGKAEDFLQLIINNINRLSAAIYENWNKGSVPDTEYKNLQFQNINCLGALNLICEAFDLEYERVMAYLSLREKVGDTTGFALAYGPANGLYKLTRSNVNDEQIVTRLRYRGGTRNLPKTYQYERLRGNNDYIENNVSTYGIIEKTINFDDIIPKREGVVSDYGFDSVKNEYSIIDNSFPFDLKAKDVNGNTIYLVNGTTAKVNFITGDCAGYTFDVVDYDHVGKIIIAPNIDEKNYTVPNEVIKPQATDKYVLIDVNMPEEYLTAAKTQLDAKAQDYLDEYSTPRVAYTLKTYPAFTEANSMVMSIGDQIIVNDADFGLVSETMRIVEMTYPLFDRYDQTIKLSETKYAHAKRKKLVGVYGYEKAVEMNRIKTPEKTSRNQKTVGELKNMVFSHKDGFFVPENNRPESLDPYMLAHDSGEPQFSLTGVALVPNYNDNANALRIEGGTITLHSVNAKSRKEIEKIISE